MRTRLLFIGLCLFLVGCGVSNADKPSIRFIGVSVGTLETEADSLQFADRFETKDQNIIGLVMFEKPMNGATVQATWFSPDDRRMPLGRTSIDMGSGATIARFSFASKEPWQPAPYQLRIDAMLGEGESQQTASGSFTFYIGMKQTEIDRYLNEYEAWKKVDDEKRAAYEARMQQEQKIVDDAKEMLQAEFASIVLQSDFTGDGMVDYIIGTTKEEEVMPPGGGGPGVLASASVDQFLLREGSGALLLSLQSERRGRKVYTASGAITEAFSDSGPIQVTVLPSKTFSLSWAEKNQMCSFELRLNAEGQYEATKPVCASQ